MNNSPLRVVPRAKFLEKYSKSACFKQGYEDYTKDKNFDTTIKSTGEQIRYERGRAFAIYCVVNKTPKAIWRKGILVKTAQERLIRALITKFVI